MKLKQIPSDFIVEEIPNYILSKNGTYSIYLFQKENIDTFEAINSICRTLSIPLSDVGYSGIKDKFALTKQFVSIPKKYNVKNIFKKNYSLVFIGFSDEPLKVGSHEKNNFILTVRDLELVNIDFIKKNLENISKCGFPNYYDSQRFGSIVEGEFIGKSVLLRDYERAIKLFLYQQYVRSANQVKFDREKFFKFVCNFEKTFNSPYYSYLKTQFNENDSNWKLTYKKIPTKQRELFVTSYQSFLWNEALKNHMRSFIDIKNIFISKYKAGEYFYVRNYNYLKLENIEKNFSKQIPLIGRKLTDEDLDIFYSKILEKEQVVFDDFLKVSKSGNFFKASLRDAFAKPLEVKISGVKKDELNKGKLKVEISFMLPKGSYATVFMKSLFLKDFNH